MKFLPVYQEKNGVIDFLNNPGYYTCHSGSSYCYLKTFLFITMINIPLINLFPSSLFDFFNKSWIYCGIFSQGGKHRKSRQLIHIAFIKPCLKEMFHILKYTITRDCMIFSKILNEKDNCYLHTKLIIAE